MILRNCHNFHDFRRLAKQRLPSPIFDYIDGAADDEAMRRVLLGALRIPEVCRLTGFGRTTIYTAIKAGDLVARRYRRRTIVLEEDLQQFLRGLGRRESGGVELRNG